MNIFMVVRSDCGTFTKLVTPSLRCGTVCCHQHINPKVNCHHHHHHLHHPQILPGITRRSVLELAAQIPNLEVEERAITLHEVGITVIVIIGINVTVVIFTKNIDTVIMAVLLSIWLRLAGPGGEC